MATEARAYWLAEPGRGELRPVSVPDPGPGEVLVRALYSGISRGTETLVHRGEVPVDQRDRMRAPHQEGDFPAPVKYGYLSVGIAEQGPPDLVGRTVFCLHPHQSAYVVPAESVFVVPDDVPARRAVLAGTVETAVNALWDAAPMVGDHIAVVGGGMVGCAVARLAAGIPGARVTLVDVDPAREEIARRLGVAFETRHTSPCDLVFHASATSAGLQTAIDLLRPEGTVIELSWYGSSTVDLTLGGTFHSNRLTIRASQVGQVALARRHRYTHTERLALALELLRDEAFDALITGESDLADLPAVMAAIADGRLPGLCHVVTYRDPTT